MKKLLQQMDFGNEAGDDVEPGELAEYFYEQVEFEQFCKPSKKLEVVTAKKGVGKSALLKWSAERVSNYYPDDIVITCRGADLVRSKFKLGPATDNPNDRARDWMIRLCAMANRAIARTIKLAITDDDMTMVESAEIDGFKSRNIVGCLLDRLAKLIPGDGPQKISIQEEIQLAKRKKDRKIWFFVDDLDATFQNTKEEMLELATFFSACRYLNQDIQGYRFRATLRQDVWPLVRRFDEASDKTGQYVEQLDWSREEFTGLLAKRIQSQAIHIDAQSVETVDKMTEKDLWDLVFEKEMKWGDKMVPSSQVIYTLSYQRPRWGIQLCKLAQKLAVSRRLDVVSKSVIDDVWGEYGKKRIADLVAEHKHQCRDVEDLINAFQGAPRLFQRDELFDYINRKVTSHVRPVIEGVDSRSPKLIARFLYRIGFILARSDGEDGYEHYSFDQMPDFLLSRTSEDYNVAWEIHPCYRQALDITKVDQSHRTRFREMRRGKKR